RDSARAPRGDADAILARSSAAREGRPGLGKYVAEHLDEETRAMTPDGAIVLDRVIPADRHWGSVVRRGPPLRHIELEGKQAVDFLCYNAADPSERYNAADTMKYAGTIFLTTGHGIYSDMGRRLFTIVEDTCGRHDTIGGCCSAESNLVRYGVTETPSCRQNFLRALAAFGLGKKDIVANVN